MTILLGSLAFLHVFFLAESLIAFVSDYVFKDVNIAVFKIG